MPKITAPDKIKLYKYLNENSHRTFYFDEMCECIGKRGKIKMKDFLTFFTNDVILTFKKNDALNYKLIAKCMSVIRGSLQCIKEDNEPTPEEEINKIRCIEEYYDDYLNRTGYEADEEFREDCIKRLLSVVDELYPNQTNTETNTETNFKYIQEIEKLTREINELKEQLKKAEKEYSALKNKYDKDMAAVEQSKENQRELKSQNKDLQKELLEKINLIDQINQKFQELEILLEEMKKAKEQNDEYKDKYDRIKQEYADIKKEHDDIKIEYENLKLKLEDIEQKEKEKISLQERHSKIEKIVYQKLFFNGATIDEMIECLKKEGLVTTKEEVEEVLQRIRTRIKIISSSFSKSPSYRLSAPLLTENMEFSIDINDGQKYFDVILLSDYHIENIGSKTLKAYEKLLKYSEDNNIGLILNLGDFYEGHGNQILKYESALANYRVIEKTISEFPQSSGIYHGVLGGNHEKNMCKYGFDPLELLAQGRNDFINLGYTHATILFHNAQNVLGKFDIHHPDTFDFPIHIDEDGSFLEQMNNYLNNIYKKLGRKRENSYIDIFGHTHTSQINYPDSYCFIPSYMKDGAQHLRIYFDDSNNINCMVFMPLMPHPSNNNILTTKEEHIYKKILKK